MTEEAKSHYEVIVVGAGVAGIYQIKRLSDLGVLTPETVLEHFVWVTDAELPIFADSGAVASNNPGSNLRLASGICRTRDIMDAGGRVGFGTDGISFSDRDDFFQELLLAAGKAEIGARSGFARHPAGIFPKGQDG